MLLHHDEQRRLVVDAADAQILDDLLRLQRVAVAHRLAAVREQPAEQRERPRVDAEQHQPGVHLEVVGVGDALRLAADDEARALLGVVVERQLEREVGED